MSEGCSFVQMKSADVKRLALATIAGIKSSREVMLNDSLDHVCTGSSWDRFWRRVFRRDPPTREDVLACWRSERWNFIEYSIMNTYGSQENVALALLNAAQHAEIVHVSANDLLQIT